MGGCRPLVEGAAEVEGVASGEVIGVEVTRGPLPVPVAKLVRAVADLERLIMPG